MMDSARPIDSETARSINIAERLRRQGRDHPGQRAIVCSAGRDADGRVLYRHLTFRQLDEESDRLAFGLDRIGIGRGCRTVLMVRPGLDFFSLTFALFKVGAVPVMIDPGMGRARLLECIREVDPQAMVGIPQAHLARLLFPRYFKSVKRHITVGRRWFWGGPTLADLKNRLPRRPGEIWQGCDPYPMARTRADEMAAILFTTGSTGPAKGVVYEHGMFDAQVDWIQKYFDIQPGDIDLAAFPLFALFSCAMGMTCVIPDMDPSRPAQANPELIVEAIRNQGCVSAFGSPVIWDRVSAWCVPRGVRLPTLRRTLTAGAPVSPDVLERMRRVMSPEGDCHTPYGATEALPVASISGSEVLNETAELTRQGRGVCVGQPVAGVTARIITVRNEPIETWSDDITLPAGKIGEIAVQGRVVTRLYYNRPRHTLEAKIADGDRVWHRMGDLGYFDEQGRLWFCGRKTHRVVQGDQVWHSVCCEAIYNRHPAVRRSALVGVGPRGDQRPVIVIEAWPDRPQPCPMGRADLVEELMALGAASDLTRDIRDILFHPSFPVDIRHNAKIFREKLAAWATGILGCGQ